MDSRSECKFQICRFHMSVLLRSEVLPRLARDFPRSEHNRRETIDFVDQLMDDDEEAHDLCGLLLIALSIPGMCVIFKSLILCQLL